ncbi:uncharacterized protein LOC143227109 [Tachypleus tridentatus]|uniref:uncharacterized protein LOC143227109 n=1 Tax=Tachypleus tridentatus TaxID=6853 RepID=UPI003FD3BF57
MKVIFAALVVLLSVSLIKGVLINSVWQKMCKAKAQKPVKANELKECMDSVFKDKSDWLPNAVQECEFAKFRYQNYEDFMNEMCKPERYAVEKEIQQCIIEKFEEAKVNPESTLTALINSCV